MRASLVASSLAFVIVSLASHAHAADLYVDDDAAAGGDGSMARPFASIQDAIDAAANGDDIRVAEGTYGAIDVDSKELHLFGSYDAAFATRSDAPSSIVEGDAKTPAARLYESASSVLDRFVLRGGQAGVFIDADFLSTTNAPEIRDNLIEGNGDPTLYGGGISARHCDARIVGNTVRDNVGDRGSGIFVECNSVVIERNVIERNVSSGDHGGGLYLNGGVVVRENVVRDNEVGVIATYGWGAGVTVYNPNTVAVFERNVFTGNLAQSAGSGVFVDEGASATFTGDLFFANRCGDSAGAGLYVNGGEPGVASSATLVNVTLAEHRCPTTRGNAIFVEDQASVVLRNVILWGNGGDDYELVGPGAATVTATYTLSEEPLEGEGNVSADPLFADAANGDFHVRSTVGRFDPATSAWVMDAEDSPTIDTGDPTDDYALEPGPNGMRINMGHTGNTAEASMGGPGGMPPPPPPPPIDGGAERDASTPSDAGTRSDASTPPIDSGARSDAGSTGGGDDDGCGCRAAGSRNTTRTSAIAMGALAMLGVVALRARRRARTRESA